MKNIFEKLIEEIRFHMRGITGDMNDINEAERLSRAFAEGMEGRNQKLLEGALILWETQGTEGDEAWRKAVIEEVKPFVAAYLNKQKGE